MVKLGIIVHSLDPLGASFGYYVTPEQNEKLALPKTPKVLDLPPVSCLHTIVAIDNKSHEKPHIAFEKPFKYAHARGFEIVGYPWAHIILTEINSGAQLRHYVELWIPIN